MRKLSVILNKLLIQSLRLLINSPWVKHTLGASGQSGIVSLELPFDHTNPSTCPCGFTRCKQTCTPALPVGFSIANVAVTSGARRWKHPMYMLAYACAYRESQTSTKKKTSFWRACAHTLTHVCVSFHQQGDRHVWSGLNEAWAAGAGWSQWFFNRGVAQPNTD